MSWPQSARNARTGPGSRGGRWHDPEYRRDYHRAWRAAHPEYRERERLRMGRQRAREHGEDPAGVVSPSSFPRPLPVAAMACPCGCGCLNEVPVVACGMCLTGLHHEET